jgi:hypothetical protein
MFYSGIGTQRNGGRFLKAGMKMTFPVPRAIWVARFPGELDPSLRNTGRDSSETE